eukprot:TRINITY_DN2513_c0_g1_i1.p1 TRINITY_DN2513_c0_g1~~TRINITY_DN2513_c0_g1_i1.p1  ORF type:complete len:1175 (-),score=244.78 TRINITY_DN2513_c0_g1_i1:43-3567(-)
MGLKSFILASILLGLVLFSYETHAWEEGEELNVYIVPHSHNDPGWWETFEGYYQQWTKGIITSVVNALSADVRRKFIWAEISYFQRWWEDQNEDTREKVRRLVQNEQLEFVTGGWVMPDEAASHVRDIVNQLTEGNEWLEANLEVRPRFAWAIDPFGHSPTMAYVLSQAGFDGMVINRAHQDIKADFRNRQHLEFYWGDTLDVNRNNSFSMFTHMFPWKLYDIPNTCGPDWDLCAQFDFERDVSIKITESNVAERSRALIGQYKQKAAFFKHNHLLVPLGDDFKYKTLDMTVKIMDQYQFLMDYINSDRSLNVNIKFATLSDYFDNVAAWESDQNQQQPAFPSYTGDFFTYNDINDDYWSGYYTTRPFTKGLSRSTQSTLHTGEALFSLARTVYPDARQDSEWSKWFEILQECRRNIGLFQHHDGITGTARSHVVVDYTNRLHKSTWAVKGLIEAAIAILAKKNIEFPAPLLSLDHTSASATEAPRLKTTEISLPGEGKAVLIFNDGVTLREEVTKIIISNPKVIVKNQDFTDALFQINPIFDGDKISEDRYELYFVASVPPLGFSTYFILPVISTQKSNIANVQIVSPPQPESIRSDIFDISFTPAGEPIRLQNRNMEVLLNSQTGEIQSIKTKGEPEIPFSQQFLEYSTSRSGAYLFLPNREASVVKAREVKIRIATGALVKTMHVSLTGMELSSFTVTLRDCFNAIDRDCDVEKMIEISHMVDMRSYGNKEFVTRFNTNIKTNGIFFTDNNGMFLRERRYSQYVPIQGNFYPMTETVMIQDSPGTQNRRRINVLSKQALGVSSLAEGQIEIMLDRRLNQDDARGLGQPINDNVITNLVFWIVIEDVESDAVSLSDSCYQLLQQLNFPLTTVVGDISEGGVEEWKNLYKTEYSTFHTGFPTPLRLLNLDWRHSDDEEVILRVYNPSLESQYFPVTDYFENSQLDLKEISEYYLSLMFTSDSEKIPTTLPGKSISTFLVKLTSRIDNSVEGANIPPDQNQVVEKIENIPQPEGKIEDFRTQTPSAPVIESLTPNPVETPPIENPPNHKLTEQTKPQEELHKAGIDKLPNSLPPPPVKLPPKPKLDKPEKPQPPSRSVDPSKSNSPSTKIQGKYYLFYAGVVLTGLIFMFLIDPQKLFTYCSGSKTKKASSLPSQFDIEKARMEEEYSKVYKRL